MSASENIKLEILSPEKIIFRGEALTVSLPGKLGYMTVLPGHASMIAELDAGILTFGKASDGNETYFVGGGFVEVRDNHVRVLVDFVEKTSEINPEEAKKALANAQAQLDSASKSGVMADYEQAGIAFKQAETRVNAASAR